MCHMLSRAKNAEKNIITKKAGETCIATDVRHFMTILFSGRGAHRVSTMVLLGGVMVCSRRLSIQTTVVSGTV